MLTTVITWVLACALVPIVVCIAAGSATGNRLSWPGADMLVGFGLVSGALSILAVTTRISLSWLMICLATLSMIAPLMRRRWPGGSSTWIALALVSPILIRAAGSEPAMWDDFWNWLPSAAYAYSHDSLVWPDLPPSFSKFPGYPQGMPLMIAAASFIGGRFLNQPATGGPPVPRPGVSVDVWDGFVDDAGRFTPQGPDYQGQIRRLRTRDGVLTKFGARKLALYVEREIERSLSRTPVALPVQPDQEPRVGKGKPRAPARPEAGPVVPLTGANVGRREELLDGAREQPAIVDPVANRVRSMGEGLPTGRADDFSWPRGATNIEPNAPSAAAKK